MSRHPVRTISALILGAAVATSAVAQDTAAHAGTNGESFRLERVLPADSFLFGTFAGLDALAGAGEELGLYNLFRDAEMQAFLKPLIDHYTAVSAQTSDRSRGQWEMIKGFLRGRLSIGIGGLTVMWTRDGPIPMPGAVASLELGDRRESFEQILPMLLEEIRGEVRELEEDTFEHAGFEVRGFHLTHPRGPRFSIYMTFVGDTLLVGFNKPLFAHCLEATRNGGGEALAGSASFQRCRNKLGSAAMNEFYLNIPAFTTRLRGLVPAEWLGAMNKLGLDRLEGIYHASGVDSGDGRDVIYLDAPEPRGGLWDASRKPLRPETLDFVPANATAFIAARSDDANSWDLVWSVMEDVVPKFELSMVKRELAQFEQQAGISIRDDILGAFGDEAVLYAELPKNGVVPNVVASFAVRDRAKMQKVLGIGMQMAGLQTREVAFGDHTIHLVTLPDDDVPIKPAFSLLEDRLLVSISLNGIRGALRRMKSGGDSITQSPAFAEAFRNLDWKGANSVMYADARSLAAYGYNMLETFLPGMVDDGDVPLDPAMMPMSETVTKHLHGWACVGRWDRDGYSTTMRAPVVPGSLVPLVALFLHKSDGNPIEAVQRLVMQMQRGGFKAQTPAPAPARREG